MLQAGGGHLLPEAGDGTVSGTPGHIGPAPVPRKLMLTTS